MRIPRITWIVVAVIAAGLLVFPPSQAWGAPAGKGHAVKLKWKPSRGAISYNVYRSKVSGGPYKKIGKSSTPSYVDSAPPRHTVVYYVVTAVRGRHESKHSAEIKATVP
jgi:fibronectin type 3 domain-containing protein